MLTSIFGARLSRYFANRRFFELIAPYREAWQVDLTIFVTPFPIGRVIARNYR